MSTTDTAEMVDAVSVSDVVSWSEVVPGSEPPRYHHRSCLDQGKAIRLPAGEFERLVKLRAVAAPRNADVALAAVNQQGASLDDAALEDLDFEELRAYLTQHPDEAERVQAVEAKRAETAKKKPAPRRRAGGSVTPEQTAE